MIVSGSDVKEVAPAGPRFSRGNVSSLKEGLKSIPAAQSYREKPASSRREEMQHDLVASRDISDVQSVRRCQVVLL